MSEKFMAQAPPSRSTATADIHPAARPLLLLLSYGATYFVLRLAVGGTLERDEAEIVYLVQDLRLGYGTQPPLYAWLQWLVFEAFGLNWFGLLVLKDVLLMGSYFAMARAAHPLVGPHAALAAAAALALSPQIGWEGPRIQTHSVLVVTLSCATLWCYVALLGKVTLPRYAILGLLCGLGLQAKYNYGFLLSGLVVASLLVPEHRRALWTYGIAPRGIALAVGVAVLALLPHLVWVAHHPDAAFAGTVSKMQDGMPDGRYGARVLLGTWNVLQAAVVFALLPLAALVVAVWPLRRARAVHVDPRPPASRCFLWLYATNLVLLLGVAFSGQVGTVKDRWMIPVLFHLPLAAFVLVPALRTPRATRRVWRLAVVFAFGWLALLPLRVVVGSLAGRITTVHHPYAALARVVNGRCPAARAIVTESLLTAGNLRFVHPAWRAVLLDADAGPGPPLAGPVALVTHAGAWTGWQGRFNAAYPAAVADVHAQVELPLGYGAGGTMAFAIACARLPAP
jgi:4-amino-4-deoxy-L-arabinose transferase-like glycosyltransferase